MPRVKSCAPKAFPENGDNQKFWITLSRKSSIYLKWLAFQHVPASLTVGTVVPVKAVLLPFTNKAAPAEEAGWVLLRLFYVMQRSYSGFA